MIHQYENIISNHFNPIRRRTPVLSLFFTTLHLIKRATKPKAQYQIAQKVQEGDATLIHIAASLPGQ